MAYDEKLAGRIRQALGDKPNLMEKKMFGGIAFLLDDKMCVGVSKDELIIRCEPEMTHELLRKKGARIFDMTGKPMKGWLLVSPEGVAKENDFRQWIDLALEYNKKAQPARKK